MREERVQGVLRVQLVETTKGFPMLSLWIEDEAGAVMWQGGAVPLEVGAGMTIRPIVLLLRPNGVGEMKATVAVPINRDTAEN